MILIVSISILQLDYVIYRRVLRYYSGEEDGLGKGHLEPACCVLLINYWAQQNAYCTIYLEISDMRKALSRDVEKKSIIPLKRPVTPDELEYD
ncbi:putative transferase [Helianthus annuus]|nr:putative transferase [Helianthus annuus]KAJ0762158.1 putative transferase [Helianthus annuus]